jgi:tRNA threonylcarbamoyl adenosine modification protein YjeE
LTETVLARFEVETPEQMHDLGLKIAKELRKGDLVLLSGQMGAGKTTLSRGVGEGLKVLGTVSSPTFVIARTHKTRDGQAPLVHVDAYRLTSPAELDDLDIDFENSIVLVEWGRGFTEGIVDSFLDVEIIRSSNPLEEVREVSIIGVGERWLGVTF